MERKNGPRCSCFTVLLMLCVLLEKANGVGLPPGHAAVTGDKRLTWDYATVANWPTLFPDFCSGIRQSPINVDRFGSRYEKNLFPMRFHNYDVVPSKMTATNNGHTVTVTFETSALPQISKGNLPGLGYTLAQYHLHWGADGTKGSEHTINSIRYPMELHLVHYKNKYGNLNEAINHSDGLAVLGIMFVISTDDNPNLKPLIDTIPNILTTSAAADKATNIAISSLLPADTSRFYRYEGGLTTPTCNEVVIWTVFTDTITVSEAQLTVLRTLKDANGAVIQDNYRPPQPLNKRTVRRNFIN